MVTLNRQEQNDLLRKHGYRWKKIDGMWQLFNILNKATTVDQAMREIETDTVPQPPVSLDDRLAACRWSESVVAACPLILDTETTGLGGTDTPQVIEIALIETDGTSVLNTLVKPTCAIESDARALHRITDEMLEAAPSFPDLWRELQPLLASREIVIYNSAYDLRVLRHCAALHGLTFPDVRSHCLMKQYAAYTGVIKIDCGCYAYHTLEVACAQIGITTDETSHRALIDARLTNALLAAMENSK